MAAPAGTASGAYSLLPNAQPGRRILAVDCGRKRIGLALSDELGITARPLETLERANRRDDMRRLREVVREHHVGRIIVGYPLHLDGKVGEMAEEAARFAGRLRKEVSLEVELVDERLTTWEAEQTVLETRQSSRRHNKPVDDMAAAVLLREYLERKREHGPAKPPESE